MYSSLLFILAFALFGCAAPPSPPPPFAANFRNACLPEASAMVEGLRAAKIAAQVVVYTYGPEPKPYGHAVASYLYPTGANQLWVWDSTWGSARVRAYWTDAKGIAQGWGDRTGMLPVHKAEIIQ